MNTLRRISSKMLFHFVFSFFLVFLDVFRKHRFLSFDLKHKILSENRYLIFSIDFSCWEKKKKNFWQFNFQQYYVPGIKKCCSSWISTKYALFKIFARNVRPIIYILLNEQKSRFFHSVKQRGSLMCVRTWCSDPSSSTFLTSLSTKWRDNKNRWLSLKQIVTKLN